MASPGSGSSSDVMRLDDRDSRINYTPIQDWFTGGGSGEYLSTTVGTRAAGSRMQFAFTGTYVAIYGTISANVTSLPTSNIFTLSSASNPSEDVFTWTAKPIENALYGQKFYESPADLKWGTYTITMDIGVRDSETWVDYLEFNQGNPESITNSNSASSGHSQLSTGAIAGIAAGGAVILILVLVAVIFWRKKRLKRQYDLAKAEIQMSLAAAPEPFPYTSNNQPFSDSATNISFTEPLSHSTNPSTGVTTHTSSTPSAPNSAAAVVPSTALYRNEKRTMQRHLTNGDEGDGLPDQPPSYQP